MVKITATGTWLRFFFAMFSTNELKWSNTQPHKRLVFFLLVPVLHRRHGPQAWRPVPNKLSLGGGAWDKAIRVLETWSLVAKLGRTEAVLWAPFAILGRFGCGREGGYQHCLQCMPSKGLLLFWFWAHSYTTNSYNLQHPRQACSCGAFEQLGMGNQELRFGTTTIIMDFQPFTTYTVWCGGMKRPLCFFN